MDTTSHQSDCYKINTFFWKIFGLWPGSTTEKTYKYYSVIFICFTVVAYVGLLTLSLLCCPLKIDILIQEAIFYFTDWAAVFKVVTILITRKKILELFAILDSDLFRGKDDVGNQIIEKTRSTYRILWIVTAGASNVSFVIECVLPIFLYMFFGSVIELPVCQYYFLSEEVRDKYFVYLFAYQSFGIYVHMMYNVNADTFMAGLLLMAIAQVKVLKHHFSLIVLKCSKKVTLYNSKEDIRTLKKLLQHYDLILRYCALIQNVVSLMLFLQFCMATCILCVTALLMIQSTESFLYLLTYSLVMVMQIFLPAWLGTQLTYDSHQLPFAAYNIDWLPQSKAFSRNLRLFMERSNTPLVISLKMFPLSVATFLSILKTAYSFFTLFRNIELR